MQLTVAEYSVHVLKNDCYAMCNTSGQDHLHNVSFPKEQICSSFCVCVCVCEKERGREREVSVRKQSAMMWMNSLSLSSSHYISNTHFLDNVYEFILFIFISLHPQYQLKWNNYHETIYPNRFSLPTWQRWNGRELWHKQSTKDKTLSVKSFIFNSLMQYSLKPTHSSHMRTWSICLTIISGARSLMDPTNTVVTGGFSSLVFWKNKEEN